MVPVEALEHLSDGDVEQGVTTERRDKLFRTMVRNSFDYHLNEVTIEVDWGRVPLY